MIKLVLVFLAIKYCVSQYLLKSNLKPSIPYKNSYQKFEKVCITVIDHEKHDYNAKLITVDINIANHPGKSSLITIRMNIIAEQVDQLRMHVKIGIIDDKNGMKYKKEFMRAAIDIPKFLSFFLTLNSSFRWKR